MRYILLIGHRSSTAASAVSPQPISAHGLFVSAAEAETPATSYASTGMTSQISGTSDFDWNSSGEEYPEPVETQLSGYGPSYRHGIRDVKNYVIDQILNGFFDFLLSIAFRQCAPGATPSESAGKSNTPGVQTESRGQHSSQRGNGDKRIQKSNSQDDGDGSRTPPGRALKRYTGPNTGPRRFACPYFKRNPRRFAHRSPCSGSGFPDTSRLK